MTFFWSVVVVGDGFALDGATLPVVRGVSMSFLDP